MNKFIYRFTLSLFIFISITSKTYSQVGIGTQTPNSKSALEIVSSNASGQHQGILIPRLTTSERSNMALSNTETGMLVYDKDVKDVFHWNGTGWNRIGEPDSSLWSINTPTEIYTLNAVGIGTTNPATQKLHVADDIIIGGGASNHDSLSEFMKIDARTGAWYIGARNVTTIENSDFFIGLNSDRDSLFCIKNNGNIGLSNYSPEVKLDVAGGIALKDTTVSTNNISSFTTNEANHSYYKFNATGSIVLFDGNTNGQFLIIQNTNSNIITVSNAASGNVKVNLGSVSLGEDDTLSLIWDGNNWIQFGYSDN